MCVHQSRIIPGLVVIHQLPTDRSLMFLNPNDTAALMLMWIVPSPPLPSPLRLVALTHRPRHWWVARFLAYAGNGIPLPCVTRLMYEHHLFVTEYVSTH